MAAGLIAIVGEKEREGGRFTFSVCMRGLATSYYEWKKIHDTFLATVACVYEVPETRVVVGAH